MYEVSQHVNNYSKCVRPSYLLKSYRLQFLKFNTVSKLAQIYRLFSTTKIFTDYIDSRELLKILNKNSL